MPSTHSLISRLKADYPQFSYKPASEFLWSPSSHTVHYATNDHSDAAFILHELSHGLLGHSDYTYDIELLAMERSAWDKALELSTNYDATIQDDLIQSTLDTYRDWLHARSTCPVCSAVGSQSKKNLYSCPACLNKWKVNEARLCRLRRVAL